jgi:ubiquinol-cytochrome c reductase cytochrome c subunit
MRAKLRGRILLLPGLVVAGVAVAGILTAGGAASGAGSQAASSLRAAAGADPITYHAPPASYIPGGQVLFEENCASCHAPDASGNTSIGAPNLQGLGPATVDFWVSTGRMPLTNPSQPPMRRANRFSPTETLEIVAFVSSLAPTSPDYPSGIPHVNTAAGDVVQGNSLFVLNCAGCHTITGAGDALADGVQAPSLHRATPTQGAEAIPPGPTQMPHFGPGNLSDQQVADIVAYVTGPIQHPVNRGGLGLGGIGPVTEGFIGLLFGVGGLMLVAFWLGDRS